VTRAVPPRSPAARPLRASLAPGDPGRARRAGRRPAGGLPDGFPESLADGLANLPPGLNFPSPAQDNVPAAFRANPNAKRRKKK